MKKLILIMIGLLASSANAAIIDFNSNPDDNYWVTPIVSNGYIFTDITGQGSLGTASNLDDSSVDNGTVHLMDWVNNDFSSTMRMEAVNSNLFDLLSFDFTSGYLDGSDSAIELSVAGYDASDALIASTIFTSVEYDHTSFTTLYLDASFSDLQYVVFDALGYHNRVGYDDIVVKAPEPASLALFGLGLIGMSVLRRRRAN